MCDLINAAVEYFSFPFHFPLISPF
uniref:Uncharacterized protein n=1 Tax=Rhizophora mucronata TaxID=61149 RepID=A0A2P2R1S3_RHIMU